jgi:hypothetical protein
MSILFSIVCNNNYCVFVNNIHIPAYIKTRQTTYFSLPRFLYITNMSSDTDFIKNLMYGLETIGFLYSSYFGSYAFGAVLTLPYSSTVSSHHKSTPIFVSHSCTVW